MNDDEQVSNVNWKWFCILAGTMILAGVATYFFLPRLISKTETDVTIVKALKEPLKVKPTEPSGKIVDHQNLLVVDLLQGGTREAEESETLRPMAPNPEPPPVNVIIDSAPATPDKTDKDMTVMNEAQKVVSEPKTMGLNAEKSANKQIIQGPNTNMATPKKILSAKNKAVKKPVAEEFRPKKESAPEIKKRIVVIEGSAPLYMIQLAAFRSVEKATEMAKILSQKHKSRLKDVLLGTMSVDTGSNGIFHRIVSGPLLRQDADRVCSILRRSGQDCFLRKYETTTP